MKSIELFNGLNGTVATREDLQAVIDVAKKENEVDVIYRTSKILNDYPEDQEFKIEVAKYPNTGLNAPRHVGIYKEALDNCGRLRKGFMFENGSVVRVSKKPAPKPKAPVKPKVVKKTAPKPTKKPAPKVEPKAKKTASNYGKKTARVKKPAPKVAPKAVEKVEFSIFKKGNILKSKHTDLTVLVVGDSEKPYNNYFKGKVLKMSNDGNVGNNKVGEISDFLNSESMWFSITKNQLKQITKKPAPKVEPVATKKSENFYKKYNIPEDQFLSFYKSKFGASEFYKNYNLDEIAPFEDFYKDYLLHLYNNNLKGGINYTDKQTIVTIESELLTKKVSVPKIEKDKFLALKNIVSTDSLRPVLQGVYIEKDSLVATDAHKLVVIHTKNNENVGKIKSFVSEKDYTKYLKTDGRDWLTRVEYFKKYEFVDGKYPNYQAIIPQYKNFSKLEPIEKWLQIAKNYSDVAGKIHSQLHFLDNENEIFVNPKLLYQTLEALAKNGTTKVSFAFGQERKPILIHTETKDYGLVMPIIKGVTDTINLIFSNPLELKGAYNSSGLGGAIGKTLFDNLKEVAPKKSIEKKEEKTIAPAPKKNSKIQKIALAGNDHESEFYKVSGEVGKFLQAVERKPVESVVITMDGQQGAGKTTTLYKFMDSFAGPGNKCLFLSLEEHPSSSLAKDKVSKYLSSTAQENIDSVGEVENIAELYEFVQDYEIIFIDSWQKLQRMVGAIRLDEDLRKKFHGKVFVIIFQQTTNGRTKGGAEVVFDGDIIIKMVKEPSFADNYAYFDKNRYTKVAIEDIRYNIASGKTYNPNAKQEAPATEMEPSNNVEFSFIVN